MTMLIHTLNLYQKPKAGSLFLRRLPVYNYRHKISAIGGFDTASCDIRLRDVSEADQFLNQHIGNRVAVFVDNPVEPIWEGFINRMTFAAGGYSYTISLDEMINRASITYSAAGTTTNTAETDNTDSQAVYGIKQGNIDMGYQASGGTSVAALQATILSQRAWPKASDTQGGGNGLVTLELLGFYHTLTWEKRTDTGTGAITPTSNITTRILPNLANTNTFFDNTDFTDVATNTVTASVGRSRGQTAWEILQEFAEIGDNTNYWVVGITPTNPNSGTRRLYYRAFNATVEYTARRGDGLRVRNLYGRIIPPWTVRPDRGIRITDMLPGWNGLGDDPRESWIATVDYDANQQSVTWSGDDNTKNEGAFQLKRYEKIHGTPFGALRRVN